VTRPRRSETESGRVQGKESGTARPHPQVSAKEWVKEWVTVSEMVSGRAWARV